MTKKCDVLIVGAGPAGLSTAIECAKKNLHTIIIEKSSEIGYPVKTSAGTWMDFVKDFGISSNSICQTINSLYIHSISSNEDVEVKWDRDVLCTLQYHNFIKELCLNALTNGAQLMVSSRVTDVTIKGNKISTISIKTPTHERTIKPKITVDASGPTAIISKKFGLSEFKESEIGIGAEYEMINVNLKNPKRMDFYTGYDVTPISYAWVFPTGNKTARVGIASVINNPTKEYEKFQEETGKNLYDCFENLLTSHPIVSKMVKNAKILEFHRGIYPLGGQIKKPYADGLLVVGDAASQASPLLGEGIRFALIFGTYAGEVASKAIKINDYSEKTLKEYHTKCNQYLGKKFEYAVDLLNIETDEYWDTTIKYIKKLEQAENYELILKMLKNELEE